MAKNKICIAIQSRKLLSFSYDGGIREVEPYCYGITKKGKEMLRAYQVDGYSKSGNRQGWKLFDVSKIFRLEIIDKTFINIRPEYNPNDSVMIRIFCRI
ncbi:MAG: hypothetical protein ACP6IY_18830 [Promethearchaeia archaeon]